MDSLKGDAHLRVVSIASGSSGNSILIKAGSTRLLIDAGMTARRLACELRALDTSPRDVTAILLTHEHADHVGNVGAFARKHRLPVIANEETLAKLALAKVEQEVLRTGGEMVIGSVRVLSFPLPHDASKTVGYLLEYGNWKVCLATDLGFVPEAAKPLIRASDLVVLEANHDTNELINGPYPDSLKLRILGPAGHLSNHQAAECIAECASSRPQWFWLAHLSEVNNSPRRALRTVKTHLQRAGISTVHVDVALRDRRSLIWDSQELGVQQRLL